MDYDSQLPSQSVLPGNGCSTHLKPPGCWPHFLLPPLAHSPSTQNRSPRSNPIVLLSRLLFCCSLIRPRVYQTLSRQVLSAFSSNLVRRLVNYTTDEVSGRSSMNFIST